MKCNKIKKIKVADVVPTLQRIMYFLFVGKCNGSNDIFLQEL